MGRLLLVRPGAGSPEVLSLEGWQALTGRLVACRPGDPLGARLADAGATLIELSPAGVPAARATPQLKLITHTHATTAPAEARLAEELASLAATHGECAFIVPDDGEAIVRAVLERAMHGGVEVEVVIGRAPRGHRLLELVRVMARLRGPGGCPWDAEQTHQTLAKYLLDETYELLEAVEKGSEQDVAEELGDLLLQVVFHAQLGTDASTFDIDDVADSLVRKLVRRHPHVFGDVTVSGADEVVANWDVIKEGEKERTSVLDGVPEALPALAYAAKIQRRASLETPAAQALHVVREVLARLGDKQDGEAEIGELLLRVVSLSRSLGVDAETALRRSARAFRDRVATVEKAAKERGASLRDLTSDELAKLWTEAR